MPPGWRSLFPIRPGPPSFSTGPVPGWAGMTIPRPAHAALALLRGIAPVDAARAQALHAEAAFHVSPAWALTWLDEALEQIERHGQHHLKARLLELKARALEANGLLGASSRFLELARETARRQGAWRYLHRMAV
jgi:hypothetical protein